MRYVGPVAFKDKLTVDNRGIDRDTKIHLNEGAAVVQYSEIDELPAARVGTVDWIWDNGSEIWAALELDGMPPDEDNLYPQLDLKCKFVDFVTRGSETWFVNEVTVVGIHLGKCPVWTDLPPVKPS